LFFDNQADCQWRKECDPPQTRTRRAIGSIKIMIPVFFSGDRIIYRSFLNPGLTMNSENFISTILKPMILRIQDQTIDDPFPVEDLTKTSSVGKRRIKFVNFFFFLDYFIIALL
jgi:hypothetical protein